MSSLRWLLLLLLTCSGITRAAAQAPKSSLELSFTPADRVQLAVWVERDDGLFMGTLALTHAVAKAGIGNRPGALQMNSGFRWPYGRREGVLPVWAHRRAAAPGARQFKRVIFQNRGSEGYASRTSADYSVDDYYCLSFNEETTGRDALDAVTCASVFSSDKGRFMGEGDRGYAEPFETDGQGDMRELSPTSLYPPRRDVERCTASGCYDHPDVSSYKNHALEVMPELDAITQATPQGQRPVTWRFPIAPSWDSDHGYTLFIEANVEGDYNGSYGPDSHPTPDSPNGRWDSWAKEYGYPYRGQPSVVYALPFTLSDGDEMRARDPIGYGDLQGLSGELFAMNPSVTNDARGAPGSGADRLRLTGDARAFLRVVNCTEREDSMPSLPVQDVQVSEHPDRTRAHMWARLSFRTPAGSDRLRIAQYYVRIRAEGGDWEHAFTPDGEQELLPVALDVCADPDDMLRNRCLSLPPGSPIEVDLAGLRQSTKYEVAVTASSSGCAPESEPVVAEFSTPMREFTTVSPCFVATAAYGSPLVREIGVLRRFRDRHLLPHALGRSAVDAYYRLGPALAAELRKQPLLRDAARALLDPVVALVDWWLE